MGKERGFMKNKKLWIGIIIIITLVLLLTLIVGLILGRNKSNHLDRKDVTVTFNTVGGTGVKDMRVKEGTVITLPSTAKDGYNFKGWYFEDKKIGNTYKIDQDTSFTAKWEIIPEGAKTFTITFDSVGGTTVEKLTLECDKEISLPANPTKEGYTFIHWQDKNERPIINKALLACEDVTLYAKWEKKEEEKKEEKPEEPKEKEYTCPEGYTLEGTNCIMTKEATDSCDKQNEKDYNGKCYVIHSYQPGTCKLMTGSTTPGNPILEDGVVIKVSGDYYCVKEALDFHDCDTNPEKRINGTCYRYSQNNGASYNPCRDYEESEYVIGNALYDPSIGRTNVASGCYTSVPYHKLCEEGFTLSGSECIKTIEATEK